MSEWGPWIEHDGKGCPCVGEYVQIELNIPPATIPSFLRQTEPKLLEGIYPEGATTGAWSSVGFTRVIRYRIRRPRGMAILNAILTNLPAPVKQYEVTK